MTETAEMTYDWQPFLARWSGEWADAYDPDEAPDAGDQEVLEERWLGFAPATGAGIAALEERIGLRLPPSYRQFLGVTDGWRHAGGFVWRLAGTREAYRPDSETDLTELFLEHLREDASPAEFQEALVWTRGLQLDVESDAVSVALDPEDVDEHGEWAVLTWAPWRAAPPERHRSFWEFMQAAYREFHQLEAGRDGGRLFANATTEALDAQVEEARRDALRGDYERAEAALAEACAFGRPRATALREQLTWMLGDRHTNSLGGLAADPRYAPDLLPALINSRERRSWGDGAYEYHLRGGAEEVRALEGTLLEQFQEGTYAYTVAGPFGGAVAAAREQMRWGEADAAWRTLSAALPRWQPLGPDHLAPVGLTADPLLGPLFTPARGRALLATPRGEEATGVAGAVVDEDPEGLAWLADRPGSGQRTAYRFLLVEGVAPATLPALVGDEDGAELHTPMTLWDARHASRPDGDSGVRTRSSYDDKALVAVGRAGPGWIFAFDSDPQPFNEARFVSPAAAASRHGRAVVVWGEADRYGEGALFHLSVAERGEQQYAFTVRGNRCERSGEIPQDLDPARLFPTIRDRRPHDGGGMQRDGGSDSERDGGLPGEATALTAIAAAFGVTLPRYALDHGRLHTFTTCSWTRPPGPGETFVVMSFGPVTP
ncbi:SMI1/KNR4 family protein [Streptomyces sp. NRRL S-920]|uniref:SMI1/KNR4 family protein n=1 Tax=Streptomyces sp. NRRL S-920 TaxID=1463921 RepID=UPI0004C71FE9|nr:SMI1/KNR4 family protein [Streptomyces sp. NRRL S-920]